MADYRALARQDAIRAGIDPSIFLRQIQQESGFNPNARSSAGALGIAQFMPGTAAGFKINPMNPVQALAAAARMDKQNLGKYGSYARMLSAYNSGRPDAYTDPKFAGGQTANYVRDILGGASSAQPSIPQGLFNGNTTGENSSFLSELAQAAQAVGGSKIRVISGYRSPGHNAAVGGVQGSYHTKGEAMDGEILIKNKWVPLGVALKGVAGKYGLRSGDAPGFFNGAPDPNHVDFGASGQAGSSSAPTGAPDASGLASALMTGNVSTPQQQTSPVQGLIQLIMSNNQALMQSPQSGYKPF